MHSVGSCGEFYFGYSVTYNQSKSWLIFSIFILNVGWTLPGLPLVSDPVCGGHVQALKVQLRGRGGGCLVTPGSCLCF